MAGILMIHPISIFLTVNMMMSTVFCWHVTFLNTERMKFLCKSNLRDPDNLAQPIWRTVRFGAKPTWRKFNAQTNFAQSGRRDQLGAK